MAHSYPLQNELGQMKRLRDCRSEVEPALHKIILEAQQKGWQPAEVAMALADAADDFILLLANRNAATH
jgi:IS30 family transposase